MFMLIVWTVAGALVWTVLGRAITEHSWTRIKWLMGLFAAGLLTLGTVWIEHRVAHYPWGIGTFCSAMCGFAIIALLLFVLIFLPRTAFLRLENLKDDDPKIA